MTPTQFDQLLTVVQLLQAEGGAARAFAEALDNATVYDLGRHRPPKNGLADIERRWLEFFDANLPALYVWPNQYLLHVAREGRNVIAHAALLDGYAITFFPRQARFVRSPAGVKYERWALGGDVDPGEDLAGFIPSLFLSARDAWARRVRGSETLNKFQRHFFTLEVSPVSAA